MVPRENKNNANVKFAGQTKSIMVFSEMAYSNTLISRLRRSYYWRNLKIIYDVTHTWEPTIRLSSNRSRIEPVIRELNHDHDGNKNLTNLHI